VALLFVLAAAAILVLNRIPFMPERDTTLPPSLVQEQAPALKKAEFFDSATGAKTGELTAKRFKTLPDGAILAEEVEVSLSGTEVGDVRLTAESARMMMHKVESGYSGRFEMAGNVEFRSQSPERELTGRFEKMTYLAAESLIDAGGPFEISSGDGITLSGTDLSGNIREGEMQFTAKRHINLTLTGDALPEGADTGGPVVIRAGGPMVFDGPGGKIRFGGDVSVTSGETLLEGSMLTLEFESGPGGDILEDRALSRMEMLGPLEGRGEDFTLVGDRLYWDGARALAGLEGEPALFASGEGFIESPSLQLTFTQAGDVAAVEGTGPGSAFFGGGRTEPPGGGRERFAASWAEGFTCDTQRGLIDMRGSVRVESRDYSGSAGRVTARMVPFEEAGRADSAAGEGEAGEEDWFDDVAERITGFDAQGDVTFEDEKMTVRGDRASYERSTDTVTITGAPVRAEAKGVEFRARKATFDRAAGAFVAERDCRVEMESLGARGSGRGRPVRVSAARVEAVLAQGALDAVCSGEVKVDWGESALSCDRLEIEGVSVEGEGREDDREVEAAAQPASVSGSGNVVFRRDELTARCGSFRFDRSLDVLELFPAEGAEVEIAFGDSATIWGRAVRINEAAQRAVCAQPRAVLWVRDSLMGFREEAAEGGPAAAERARIDLSAGEALTLTQVDEESATLEFAGGVEVTRWDSRSPIEDRLACESLTLDAKIEARDREAAKPVGNAARIVASRAAGDVYLRYWGPDGTLEARGDAFEWEAETDVGRLMGSPAVAWLSGREASATQRSNEFLYNFTDRSVELIGGGEGVLVLPRAGGGG